MMRQLSLLVACLVATLGCGDTTEPPTTPTAVRAPGRLILTSVTIPDTVGAGDTFSVAVRTLGGGCRRRTAGYELAVDSGQVGISVFDHDVLNTACPGDELILQHTVPVRLSQTAGMATLVIKGAELRDGRDVPLSLTRTIVVR